MARRKIFGTIFGTNVKRPPLNIKKKVLQKKNIFLHSPFERALAKRTTNSTKEKF
jgi:hypothetical protein